MNSKKELIEIRGLDDEAVTISVHEKLLDIIVSEKLFFQVLRIAEKGIDLYGLVIKK